MRSIVFGLMLVVAAVPAFAADAPAVRRGAVLRDSNNVRVGRVDAVRPDGSVGVIVESRYINVPANALTTVGDKLASTMTKDEILKQK